MFKLLILLVSFLFQANASVGSDAGHSGQKKDGCVGALTAVQIAALEAEQLMTRLRGAGSQVHQLKIKPPDIEVLDLDVGAYIDHLGLGEKLWPKISLDQLSDIHLSGPVAKSKLTLAPVGNYPIESFAMSNQAHMAALTFNHSYFYKRGGEGNIFLTKLDEQSGGLSHYAEISLPGAKALSSIFLNGDKTLIVLGVYSQKSDGEQKISNLRKDLYFYSLEGKIPKLKTTLTQILKMEIKDISPLDSPQKEHKYFAVELPNSYELAKQNQTNFLIVSVDAVTGEVAIRARDSVDFDLVQEISMMSVNDNRKGYIVENGQDLVLLSKTKRIQFVNGKLVSHMAAPMSTLIRSFFAPWIQSNTEAPGRSRYSVTDEIARTTEVFEAPNLDYGAVIPVNEGYVFIESNEPNYRTFLMLREPKSTIPLLEERLIHFQVHGDFLAGTTTTLNRDIGIKVVRFAR